MSVLQQLQPSRIYINSLQIWHKCLTNSIFNYTETRQLAGKISIQWPSSSGRNALTELLLSVLSTHLKLMPTDCDN